MVREYLYVFDGTSWVALEGDTRTLSFVDTVRELPDTAKAVKGDLVRVLTNKRYIYGVINPKPSDSCPISGWMFDDNIYNLSSRAKSLGMSDLANALLDLAKDKQPAVFHGMAGGYIILIDVHER